jgi:hypothetical protein
MNDARIMALRLAGKVCTEGHGNMAACPKCEEIADVLELYAKEQTIELRTELRDLKDVGRAKAKMVSDLGYTEASAHRHIQKSAMDGRTTAGDIARRILKGDS